MALSQSHYDVLRNAALSCLDDASRATASPNSMESLLRALQDLEQVYWEYKPDPTCEVIEELNALHSADVQFGILKNSNAHLICFDYGQSVLNTAWAILDMKGFASAVRMRFQGTNRIDFVNYEAKWKTVVETLWGMGLPDCDEISRAVNREVAQLNSRRTTAPSVSPADLLARAMEAREWANERIPYGAGSELQRAAHTARVKIIFDEAVKLGIAKGGPATFDILSWQEAQDTLTPIIDKLEAMTAPPPSPEATQAEGGKAASGPKHKRSTERGEGRVKLIAALTKHHKYADGGCLNLEPIGNNELARMAGVAKRTASKFFSEEFHGHEKYKAQCRKATTIIASLKLLNNEYAPYLLDGNCPPGVSERGDQSDDENI